MLRNFEAISPNAVGDSFALFYGVFSKHIAFNRYIKNSLDTRNVFRCNLMGKSCESIGTKISEQVVIREK